MKHLSLVLLFELDGICSVCSGRGCRCGCSFSCLIILTRVQIECRFAAVPRVIAAVRGFGLRPQLLYVKIAGTMHHR